MFQIGPVVSSENKTIAAETIDIRFCNNATIIASIFSLETASGKLARFNHHQPPMLPVSGNASSNVGELGERGDGVPAEFCGRHVRVTSAFPYQTPSTPTSAAQRHPTPPPPPATYPRRALGGSPEPRSTPPPPPLSLFASLRPLFLQLRPTSSRGIRVAINLP